MASRRVGGLVQGRWSVASCRVGGLSPRAGPKVGGLAQRSGAVIMEEEKALQLYLECYKDYLSLGLQRTLG